MQPTFFINQTIRFIKRYPEYTLEKSGTIVVINEDGTILIKTGERTMYKVVIEEVEFIFDRQCSNFI
jgi:hypothetical protein